MSQSNRDVVVPNPQGLHARPIALIAQTAARFRSALRIAADGVEVDGKSVLQMMTLCAAQGTTLAISATGDDAEQLVAAIAQVVETGFGEM